MGIERAQVYPMLVAVSARIRLLARKEIPINGAIGNTIRTLGATTPPLPLALPPLT